MKEWNWRSLPGAAWNDAEDDGVLDEALSVPLFVCFPSGCSFLWLCFLCLCSLVPLPLRFCPRSCFVCFSLYWYFFGLPSSSELAPGCWSFEGDSTVPLLCFTLPLVFSLRASSVWYSSVRSFFSLLSLSRSLSLLPRGLLCFYKARGWPLYNILPNSSQIYN